jgi:hypothetical protein
MEGEAGEFPSITKKPVPSSPRPIGHVSVYSVCMTDRLRERLARMESSLSRSDGEPAQAPPAYRGAPLGDPPSPERRTHQGVTVGAGYRAVQDAIGSVQPARL